jgi:hypothetical protein
MKRIGAAAAASATLRANQPSVSRLGALGMTPSSGMRPNVGFTPTTPQ